MRTLRQAGLSTLSRVLLGKPLDKSVQVSDWEMRPLTDRQLEYAALDSHILHLLYDELGRQLPDVLASSRRHSITFQASRQRRRSSTSDPGGGGGGGGSQPGGGGGTADNGPRGTKRAASEPAPTQPPGGSGTVGSNALASCSGRVSEVASSFSKLGVAEPGDSCSAAVQGTPLLSASFSAIDAVSRQADLSSSSTSRYPAAAKISGPLPETALSEFQLPAEIGTSCAINDARHQPTAEYRPSVSSGPVNTLATTLLHGVTAALQRAGLLSALKWLIESRTQGTPSTRNLFPLNGHTNMWNCWICESITYCSSPSSTAHCWCPKNTLS